ncbi:hypothetical protein LIER_08765 [Lithospermum erythrorhizon]|uniref:Uncharacterized protein n=1 Tax=Lithospermum erythrorhizon TaxID=34254 RepID=A0AAV3PG21_LITER
MGGIFIARLTGGVSVLLGFIRITVPYCLEQASLLNLSHPSIGDSGVQDLDDSNLRGGRPGAGRYNLSLKCSSGCIVYHCLMSWSETIIEVRMLQLGWEKMMRALGQ